MKIAAIVLLVIVLAIVGIFLGLRSFTSNKALGKVDAAVSVGENAATLAGAYGEKHPERAAAIGVIDGVHSAIQAQGKEVPAGRPVGPDTIFEIGSVTKTFTGLLLADAVVKGELTLKTTLGELLTETPMSDSVKAITLLQLSTHTSGLPRLPLDIADGEDKNNPYAHYTRERLLNSLESLPVATSATSVYSNYGVGLLGEALAIHYGTTYPELLQERVLGPLGLHSASFKGEAASRPERLTDGYMGGEITPHWSLPSLAGAGGLRMSMEDLLMLMGTIQSPPDEWKEACDLLLTEHHSDPGARVGLCWQIAGTPDDPIYWHNGATFGASSFVALRPSKNRVVAVLQNQSELVGSMLGNTNAAETMGRALAEL